MRKAPPDIDDRDDAELFRAAIGADRGKVRALPEAPMPLSPKVMGRSMIPPAA